MNPKYAGQNTLNCTLISVGDLGRAVTQEILMAERQQKAPIALKAIAGKTEDKPNILPHGVHYVTPEAATTDHSTKTIILTGGPLAKQFEWASTAITNGKHVVVSDARLMAAYGDILPKMAVAYNVKLATSGTLGANATLLPHLVHLAPFGVESLTWTDNTPLNHILAQMETQDKNLKDLAPNAEDDITLLHKTQAYQNITLAGEAFGRWKTYKGAPPPSLNHLTAYDIRTALRLGGHLRQVSHLTPNGTTTGLHFLPVGHPCIHTPNTSVITTKAGQSITLTIQNAEKEAASIKANAIMADIFSLAQNPRQITSTTQETAQTTHNTQSLLFTNTAAWRAIKDNLTNATIQKEERIGTTLAVTLSHKEGFTLPPEIGHLFALTKPLTLTNVEKLRLAV